MKKKNLAFVIAISLIVSLFASCSSANGFDKKVSEVRDCIYIGVADGYDVVAKGGEREQNYAVDGVAYSRQEFFIISLSGKFSTPPTYSVEINGKKYEGNMTKHPFNDEYTCEINAHPHCNEITVSFIIDTNQVNATLQSVNDGSFISWENALSEAVKELEIKGDYDGEIFVRLIENPVKDDGKYYWYVAFCSKNDESVSVLINATDGKVVAKKTA